MSSLRKIPATVITGFLGAGKTTLVRHLLENAGGRRIALIINEFGDIGVDREVIDGCGIQGCEADRVIELANGCICCTVADEFLPTMTMLLEGDNPPDHIVIETSGLALPKPLVKAFHWPDVRARVTVDGVIAVIDTPAVAAGRFADTPEMLAAPDHDNPLEEVFTDQLLCADMVLLNKADLLAAEALDAVTADLAGQVRGGVRLLATQHGKVPVEVLLGLTAAAEDDLEARPSHHDGEDDHDHDDFASFAVELGPITDAPALTARLAEVIAAHDILRIKGFLDLPGKPMRQVVQAVGPRIDTYFDRHWHDEDERTSRLVVIGRSGIDEGAIRMAIGAVTGATLGGGQGA